MAEPNVHTTHPSSGSCARPGVLWATT